LLSLKLLLLFSPSGLLYLAFLISSKTLFFSCLLSGLLSLCSSHISFFRVLIVCLATFGLLSGGRFFPNVGLSQASDACLNIRKMGVD
jgi:hypothetical protein